jgi:poly(hydroxyalkanoate) depolymerase family esterase
MLKRLTTALARAWRIFRGNNAAGSRVPLWILGSSLYGVPGRFIKRTYGNDAGTRAYKVYLPAGYRGQALPLVVMLHGCKQTPDDFAVGTRMNELADELAFLVVYPAQASSANYSKCWNWFRPHDQRRDGGEPSLIAGITRQVIERYKVDARRVYIAGISAGGAMAGVMAATYPDLYAAAGIHSGLPYASARDAVSAIAAMRGQRSDAASLLPAVPTIVFHGDRDMTVQHREGDYAIAGVQHKSESGEAGGRAYTRTIYRGAKAAVEHWLVHGAGHAWSGGNASAPYADAKGPNATREMLRFFLHGPARSGL